MIEVSNRVGGQAQARKHLKLSIYERAGRRCVITLALLSVFFLGNQVHAQKLSAELSGASDASSFTKAANSAIRQQLPFSDLTDYENANRGLVEGSEFDGIVRDRQGNVVWNLKKYDFLNQYAPLQAPLTVNPSLWRQEQLNNIAGLFEVVEGEIYQLRGFDLANMTLVKGETGWIVIDPLVSEEAASFALKWAYKYLNVKQQDRQVSAVIFTHSHIDHYGGVLGVTTQDRIDNGDTEIIAPDGFFQEAVNENIIAGNVMIRRATYMYGNTLRAGAKGQVGAGLGKTTSTGTTTALQATRTITVADIKTPQSIVVDGVEIEFWNTPGAEAPSEMMFYFPEHKALCTSEELVHTIHNLYSLRGTKVRDSLAWSDYLADTLNQYGLDVEVMFASHHWPTWGNDNIVELLKAQRDLYRYLHDQTLRLANQGQTMVEIAERITNEIVLPDNLQNVWANQGYYGTINHNVKAIYQRYLGWFDGNPANLHSLPPAEASRKYVEVIGGSKQVLKKGQEAYDQGEYRWAAMLLNHLVFAESENQAARDLLADAYEQMGYQAASGPWRNFYLTGASELRQPNRLNVLRKASVIAPTSEELSKLESEDYFNYLAIHLDGPSANDKDYTFKLRLTFDKPEGGSEREARNAVLRLENSVARAETIEAYPAKASPSISMKQSLLDTMLTGVDPDGKKVTLSNKELFEQALIDEAGTTSITGTPNEIDQWNQFLEMLVRFEFWFNVIEP